MEPEDVVSKSTKTLVILLHAYTIRLWLPYVLKHSLTQVSFLVLITNKTLLILLQDYYDFLSNYPSKHSSQVYSLLCKIKQVLLINEINQRTPIYVLQVVKYGNT